MKKLNEIDFQKIKDIEANNSNQQDITDSELYNNIKGYSQMITQGATYGQAPHLAGASNELSNLPKKLYSAKSGEDFGRIWKDLGKDYVSKREEAKQQMKEFAEEHPYSSLAAEIGGGLLTGGALSSVGKSALKAAIPRAMAEGGIYGLSYGASNTEGKAFDPMGSVIGAASGVLGGAALGTLGKLAKKLFLSNRVGRVGDQIRPAGIQENTINHILTDKEVAREVANGGVGKKTERLIENAQKSFDTTKQKIDTEIKNAYKGIDGNTLIDLNKPQSLERIEQAISKVEKNVGSDSQSRKILNGAKSVLKDIQATQKQSPTRKQVKGGILRDYETVTEDILRNPDRQVEIVKIPRQEITKANYNEELEKAFTLFDEASNGRKLITNSTDNIIVDVPTGAKGEIMKDLIQMKDPDLQNAAIHQIRNMQDLFYKAHKISEHPEMIHNKPNVDTVSRYATPFELINKEGRPELYRAKFTVYKYKDGRNVVSPEILEINKGKDYGLYAMKTYGGNKKSPQGLGANRIDGTNPPKYGDTISIGDLADYVNTFDNKVTLDKLKNLKDRVYRLKDSAYKTEGTGETKRLVSKETVDMLDNIYQSLVNAEKEHSPQLRFANEFYSDMKKLNEEVAKINPKGLYGEDKIGKSAAKLNKDTSGGIFKMAEDNIRKILGKYPQLEGAEKFLTDLKKAQVSTNVKPDENYATSVTGKKILDHILKGGNRDQQMQKFAQAVLDGKVTKDMLDQEFTKVKNVPVMADLINYYLAANKVPSINNLSNVISKSSKANPYLERYVLPRLTIRNILDRYYNKEQ